MGYTLLTGPLLEEMVGRGAAEVEARAATINALNVFPVPDGDTGTNMALTLRAALDHLREAGPPDGATALGDAAKLVARGVLLGARGNSGVILSQFLRGFADGVAELTDAGPKELARALERATAFAYRAVIKPVEGTMLTVGRAASDAGRRAADAGGGLLDVLRAAADGAERALARTPEQLPVLKRAGVVDAGGKGLLCFLRGILDACEGRETPVETAPARPAETTAPWQAPEAGEALAALHRDLDPSDVTYRYCTEFLIRGENLSVDVIRARLLDLGDSLLVVGDRELVKVHVHTEHPGRALEIGVAWGDLLNISIDNMREQQRQTAAAVGGRRPEPLSAAAGAPEGEGASPAAVPGISGGEDGSPEVEKRTGVVAVVQGEGWEELLSSLGVDRIVQGGQTMNPSAAELLEAVESVSAASVVLLPNNANVVFAARQARQLTRRDVHVVETKTPPAAVAALMAFNPLEEDAAVAVQAMDEAVRRVRTAAVARAVRDSDGWGDGIAAGDSLGIVDDEIRIVEADAQRAALGCLEEIVDGEAPYVSIYYGDDTSTADAEALADEVRRRWPDSEVELWHGGQPVYAYLLSVE